MHVMELIARIELATFGLRIRCTTDCAISALNTSKKLYFKIYYLSRKTVTHILSTITCELYTLLLNFIHIILQNVNNFVDKSLQKYIK